MHDAMQVAFGYVFAGKPWPFPLACVPWKVHGFHYTLTLKPYRHFTKAALVCKGTHKLFKKFLLEKLWQDEFRYYILEDVFCQAIQRFGFHTEDGERTALIAATKALRFSIFFHNAFFAGITMTCLQAPTGFHDITTHYGLYTPPETESEAAPKPSPEPVLVTTVPAGEYLMERKRTWEQHTETVSWISNESEALKEFVKAQYLIRM